MLACHGVAHAAQADVADFHFPFSLKKRPGLQTRAVDSDETFDQRGSTDEPIRNSSTARAHCRPSRIAHTTSDWPRRMSPAVNTFGTDVW
jgi:hypothetical protein